MYQYKLSTNIVTLCMSLRSLIISVSILPLKNNVFFFISKLSKQGEEGSMLNKHKWKFRSKNLKLLTHLLFWYQVFTCVSVRFSLDASSMRSWTLRYFCLSKLFSRLFNWWSVKAVLAFLGFFCFKIPEGSSEEDPLFVSVDQRIERINMVVNIDNWEL